MNISPTDTIAGQPILKVRDLLRRSDACAEWDQGLVMEIMGVSKVEATLLIAELAEFGFIRRSEWARHGQETWENTTKGNALAQAKATRNHPGHRRPSRQRGLGACASESSR